MSGVQTYWAKIFLGMRIGYTRRQFSYRQVEGTVRYHVTRYPTCVTMTRTKFAYKDGWDRGLVIGLINYPRFPSAPEKIRTYALSMAEFLRDMYSQNRVSVMFPDETIMIGEE